MVWRDVSIILMRRKASLTILIKMISEIQSLLSYMEPELQEAGEAKHGREEQKDHLAGYRVYTEQVFPRLAKELKLKEGWDYKELYLSILEDLANNTV